MPSLPDRHRRRCPPRGGSSTIGSSCRLSQREKESGALIDSRLDPDTATVSRDNSLCCSQTDSGAFKLRILVQPLERCEELVGIRHIESGAVIPNIENGLVALVLVPECNLCLCTFRRVLPGVPQQVHEDN